MVHICSQFSDAVCVCEAVCVVQGTELEVKCNKHAERFTAVSGQVENVAAEKGFPEAAETCAQPVNGTVQCMACVDALSCNSQDEYQYM